MKIFCVGFLMSAALLHGCSTASLLHTCHFLVAAADSHSKGRVTLGHQMPLRILGLHRISVHQVPLSARTRHCSKSLNRMTG